MHLFRSPKRASRGNDPPAAAETPAADYQSFHDASMEEEDQQPGTAGYGSTLQTTPPTTTIRRSSSRRQGSNSEREASLLTTSSSSLTEYRGFSSSIQDMFTNVENERIDCCALTCCGVLQNDHDRFLLQGVTPPDPCKRLTVHILLPLAIFFLAGYAALRIQDAVMNQVFCTSFLVLLLAYCSLQYSKGRRKRMDIRKDLLWTKYQMIHHCQQTGEGGGQDAPHLSVLLEQGRPEDASLDDYYQGQTAADMKGAHPCCIVGCYAQDRPLNQPAPPPTNLCHCLWYYTCQRPFCGQLLQCCGTCALAQEGRDMDRVIKLVASTHHGRIDYLTMQPMTEYYPAIYRHEHAQALVESNQGGAAVDTEEEVPRRSRFQLPPLSRLSTRLLQNLAVILVILLVWSIVGPYYWKYVVHANVHSNRLFTFPNWLLLCATFAQAILLLALLAWLGNRPKPSKLSVDAMIKLFASGFLLSTSLAVVWELFLGLLVKTLVTLVLAIAGVDAVSDPETDAASPYTNSLLGFVSTRLLTTVPTAIGVPELLSADTSEARNFLKVYGNSHPIFYTVYLFLSAFFLAAMVEEICKYFGYRMVEHPDFFSQQDLVDASQSVAFRGVTDEEAGDDDDDDDAVGQHHQRGRGWTPRPPDYAQQDKSLQSQGAAITIAMIATAMGFTCCENLVYIFIYSGSTVKMELAVLIARTFFPVHPVAAALQSIGVCRRDLESKRTTQLGRIILPAVIFHGGYDFFLLWIEFMVSRNGVYADDGDDDTVAFDDDSVVALLASFGISVVAMAAAIGYYLFQAKQQRARLIAMDRQEAVSGSRLI